MVNWSLFAGVFLQCASHAVAYATAGSYSSSCSALLKDLGALHEALATMWELRDTPDAEYPLATRATAVCAWTALQPTLQLVGEPVVDGRLLSPSGQQKSINQEKSSWQCDADHDDEKFVDEHGFSCQRWSFKDCYKELGFTASQLKAVRQGCPFTCAGCAREASVKPPPWTAFMWTLTWWTYQALASGMICITLSIHMYTAGCIPQLKRIRAWLKHWVSEGAIFSQRRDAQKSQTHSQRLYVARAKSHIRRRGAMVVAMLSMFAARARIEHMTNRAACFRLDLARSHPLADATFFVLLFGAMLCPLLPPTIVGKRGMTFVGVTMVMSTICCEFDGHGTWWYMSYLGMVAQGFFYSLPLLMFEPKTGCLYHLAIAVAIVTGYAFRFGFGTVFYHESQDGKPCHVWDVSRPLESGIGGFWYITFADLLGRAIMVALCNAFFLFGVDRALEIGCSAMGRLAQMESRENVFLALMKLMCDCVLYLDDKLVISEPTHGLTALLLACGQSLNGTDFRSLLVDDEDVKILSDALLERSARSSSILHLRMKDAMRNELHVHVYWTFAEDIAGNTFYILGITEDSARSIPPPNTCGDLPVWEDRLALLRRSRPMPIPEYGPSVPESAPSISEESCHASQISLCSSLGDRELALSVMVSWPMAILNSNCADLYEKGSSFSKLFRKSKQARTFHKLLKSQLAEVASKFDPCEFPVLQKLGTQKLRLIGIKKNIEGLISIEIPKAGESDGSEERVQDKTEDQGEAPEHERHSAAWVILHISSARRAMSHGTPPVVVKEEFKDTTLSNIAIDAGTDMAKEALKDSTPSKRAIIQI